MLSFPILDVRIAKVLLVKVILRYISVDISIAPGLLMFIAWTNLDSIVLTQLCVPAFDVSTANVILRPASADVIIDHCANSRSDRSDVFIFPRV